MTVEDEIRELAADLRHQLSQKMDDRAREMQEDDTSHYMIYRALGVTDEEGEAIDLYQNKGRFLYRYAGTFLERSTQLCFSEAFPEAEAVRIPNTRGVRPKTFQIDSLVGDDAHEIKWRDATTDGDHITKEHTRIQAIADAGLRPIRIMFYYPNRQQSIRIQKTLETLYAGIGGAYHHSDAAWAYVRSRTGIDLKGIVERMAMENTR